MTDPDSDHDRRASDQPPRTDGGTATGADETTLDPWGSSTVADYRNLFEEFGIEEFDDVLSDVPNPHYLMRRGVIFGHRGYDRVAEALDAGEPAAALSGFMPTGDPHIGHKLVFDELVWHQERGADAYGLIADLEAHSARGLDWDEIDDHAHDYLLSLLALGFDPDEGELYRQSDNRPLQDLSFELGVETNLSELESIYGFGGETDVSHMQSVVTQMADILYPQLDEPKPTVIPVGPDQDPHVRLSRDLAERMRFFGVTAAYASFEHNNSDERWLIAFAYRNRELYAQNPERPRCAEAADWLEMLAGPSTQIVPSLKRSSAGNVLYDDSNINIASESDILPEVEYFEDLADRVDVSDSVAKETIVALSKYGREFSGTVRKLREAGKEPLRLRTRFINRNATDKAFEALIDSLDGEKRVYDAHIDSFEFDSDIDDSDRHSDSKLAHAARQNGEKLARDIEVEHGGYGFIAPSSIYHRFMTGLTGGKMSSSVPASHISLLDDPEEGYEKVKSATTGGRETAELQRELGGRADECPVYELYAYLLAADDDEFATRVYEECTGGERLCGDCKEQAAELMREFLADHQEKRAEAEAVLDGLDIDLDTDRA
jgi:tryptophanyl-tRNA synthetase